MIRFAIRLLLTPLAIVLIDLLILIPVVLAVLEVWHDVWKSPDLREPLVVVEGIGVILIGWGVVLEERASLRDIFHLTEESDSARQATIDHLCHSSGVGLLVFGLFAEMCHEAIRLPNRVIDTQGLNHPILYVSVFFFLLSAYVLAQHIVGLCRMILRRSSAQVSDRH